jgi:hypothetical protein
MSSLLRGNNWSSRLQSAKVRIENGSSVIGLRGVLQRLAQARSDEMRGCERMLADYRRVRAIPGWQAQHDLSVGLGRVLEVTGLPCQ